MPTLVSHKDILFRVREGMPLADHETRVPVTERLYSFAKEYAYVRLGEWTVLDDGTHDLHPDIRWCPGDRVAPE